METSAPGALSLADHVRLALLIVPLAQLPYVFVGVGIRREGPVVAGVLEQLAIPGPLLGALVDELLQRVSLQLLRPVQGAVRRRDLAQSGYDASREHHHDARALARIPHVGGHDLLLVRLFPGHHVAVEHGGQILGVVDEPAVELRVLDGPGRERRASELPGIDARELGAHPSPVVAVREVPDHFPDTHDLVHGEVAPEA
mmetsp:Transcript_3120/g.10432  ORF Transcript_3120/g.10432 Transcript_3120/m.10432 type:complete len:200 (-) Transcript_3120:497-1096(-)